MSEKMTPPSAEELRELGDEQWDPSPVSASACDSADRGVVLLAASGIVAAIDRLTASRCCNCDTANQDTEQAREAALEMQRERDHVAGELRSKDLEIQELTDQLATIRAAIRAQAV